MFWMLLALFVATTIVGDLLAPKPKFNQPRASSLGDFQFPTATEDRVIPIVWGTCLVKGANTVWYGDLQTEAITQRVKTGLFSHKTITKGFKYRVGAQMTLCHGKLDGIGILRFGDKDCAYTSASSTNYWTVTVDKTDLFGGEEESGGVQGKIIVYKGTTTQVGDSYLTSQFGSVAPGYRGVSYLVFKGLSNGRSFYWGTQRYIKPPALELKRWPNGLGLTGNKHIINTYDANPACMIYEALTDATWGLGRSPLMINTAGLQAVGNTLYSEGFGLSWQVDKAASGDEIIGEILRHIDAVMYTDPTTGLINVALCRDDYSIPSLPVFDDTNVLEVEQYTRASWAETKNTIKVGYTDRAAGYVDRVAKAQDIANIWARSGEIAADQIDFHGCSTSSMAAKLAARCLKTMSYPLAVARLKLNRQAWSLRPGSVFVWDCPDYGIADMVMRVTRISYGELASGAITVECCEDMFAIAYTAYSPPADTLWTDPDGPVDNIVYASLWEVPRFTLQADEIRVGVFAARENNSDLAYEVWSDPAGGTNYTLTQDVTAYTPSGTLTAAYLPTASAVDATGFTLNSSRDLHRLDSATEHDVLAGYQLAVFSTGEIVGWENVVDNGDGTYTFTNIYRGMMDTVPQTHTLGTRVWFVSGGVGLSQDSPFASDATVKAKLLAYNTNSKIDISVAPLLTITTASRVLRPYPPGDFKINSSGFPTYIAGDMTVSWAHRDRLLETTTLLKQDNASVGPEAMTTYTVRVYDRGGDLVHTEAGLSGTSWTYAKATEESESDDGMYNGRLRVTVTAVRSSLDSWQAQDHTFDRAGFGLSYGLWYGAGV